MSTETTPRAPGRTTIDLHPASLALVFVGMAVPLHVYLEVTVLRWPATLVLSGVVALFGWRRLLLTRSMKHYLFWAIALSSWVVISTLVAWDPLAFYHGRIFVVWVLFIVPGLSVVLREPARQRSLIAGFVTGVGFLMIVAMLRVLRGLPVTDGSGRTPESTTGNELFGTNRNVVNAVVVFVIPLILGARPGTFVARIRWPLLATFVVWIPLSGGRAGLLGLFIVPILYAFIQPGASQRVRILYTGALVLLALFFGLQEVGGPAVASTDRLFSAIEGERTDADEARELLLRKGWHLANEHPWFGIGLGRFIATPHRVIDEGTTSEARAIASRQTEHNDYVGMMSETGFVGFFLFVLLILSLARSGFAHRDDSSVRPPLGGWLACMFLMFVHVLGSPFFALPMALLLGSVTASELETVG